ncbi:MAG: CRISPR-associated endonuclease Cas2 [Candidatus Kapabacteria bacterium]|nr:CRISPR-associated endonuclease Cas2 [Candidatus Kapabacteria bacterium]
MYCILVYDIADNKRLGRVLKLMRQYLNWIQNSVFEGHLTESQIEEMMRKAKRITKPAEDSIIMFTMQNSKYVDKMMYGVDKSLLTSNIF